MESRRTLATGASITALHQDGADAVVETGSGRYVFSYPYAPTVPNVYTIPAPERPDAGRRAAQVAR
jgi:hypothetical protein